MVDRFKTYPSFLFFIKKIMEDKIAIVFCSRKKSEELDDFILHLRETCGCDSHVYSIYNPDGMSLSRIYADIVDSTEVDSDVIVFVHDDIEFLRDGWGAEVLRLFKENEKYGIIGVAGSAQFDSQAAWWNYKKIFGQVLHRSEGKSWLTAFSPLLEKDLQEVAVIDGLFIAINKNIITANFNRDLDGFDMYDIDFCLSNLIDGKCKIGVTTNIRLAHNSVGRLKDSWYVNRDKVNEKFGSHYPIDVLK